MSLASSKGRLRTPNSLQTQDVYPLVLFPTGFATSLGDFPSVLWRQSRRARSSSLLDSSRSLMLSPLVRRSARSPSWTPSSAAPSPARSSPDAPQR